MTPEESPMEKATRITLDYVASTYVNKKHGVKGVELVTKIIEVFFSLLPVASKDQFDPMEWVEQMKLTGQLVEVEYSEVDSMVPFRIKSMYFPPGTKVTEEEVIQMAKLPFDV